MTLDNKVKLIDKSYELYELIKECVKDEPFRSEALSIMDRIQWIMQYEIKVTEE